MLTFESEPKPQTLVEPEPQAPTQTLHNKSLANLINNKEFSVYSKRKKNREEIVPQTQLEQIHEVDPNPAPKEKQTGNTESLSVLSENKSDDLELPIAIRKEVRSCIKHPIYNFLSYNNL